MMSFQLDTCLSSSVKQIICEASISSKSLPDSLDKHGLLNWNTVKSLLEGEEKDTPDYFLESSRALAPIFNTVLKYFENLDANGFTKFAEIYEKYTRWTSSPHLALSLARQLNEYNADSKDEILEWLLLYFPLLERSLGDVYLCKGRQCPSLLKDLLVTEELRAMLNPTVIKLLRILIGPPVSLNLRNVVWHGFPKPGEIPMQFAFLMLCLLPSLGQLLAENGVSPKSIAHRNSIVLPELKSDTCDSLVCVVDGNIDEFTELVEASDLVLPSMKPMWKLAIHRYRTDEYGKCASIILPQLEHTLRCLFTKMNKCPDRILTAESSAFFTTFDEMLVKTLPDGSENQLQKIITNDIFDSLLDLLNYPEGPRIRDKLSHGEVKIEKFPKELVCHIIAVCGMLISLSLTDKHSKFSSIKYESQFHPVSLLKQALMESSLCLDGWLSLSRPNVEEIECNFKWDNNETVKDVNDSLIHSLANVDKLYNTRSSKMNVSVFGNDSEENIGQWVAQTKIVTAFRYTYDHTVDDKRIQNPSENEAEVVGLLRRIAQEVVDISKAIVVALETRYQQWKRKELRSRQRNTYRHMIDSIPYISAGLRLIIAIVASHYVSLDKLDVVGLQEGKVLRLFRFMLHYCENVKSHSSLDKNRWEESVELTKELMKKVSTIRMD